jgi:hypothetical protein
MCFAIQYRWYAEAQIDYTNLWMMVVSIIFLVYDALYLFWLVGFSRKMPSFLSSWIIDSVVGDIEKVKRELIS